VEERKMKKGGKVWMKEWTPAVAGLVLDGCLVPVAVASCFRTEHGRHGADYVEKRVGYPEALGALHAVCDDVFLVAVLPVAAFFLSVFLMASVVVASSTPNAVPRSS
jgi:hypothetical protein